MTFDLKRVVRPNILTLEPYRCARDDFKTGVLLDANENTHGPALSELSLAEQELELNRYPDPHQAELKKQIVDFRNAKPNKFLKETDAKLEIGNLCLGVGSDESIDMLLRCVCVPGKDKMLICPPTYGMYTICATVNDVVIAKVPLTTPDFQIDFEAVTKKLEEDPSVKLIYLTSPGNPTAKLISPSEVVRLLEYANEKSWNGLVVIDEAYIDFTESTETKTSKSVSTLVTKYPQLVVLQTLSKSFGLAGIRLGITFCSKELSYYLNSMKYPYNISSLTSNVAIRATDESTGLQKMSSYVEKIIEQRGILLKQLLALPGVGKNIGGLDSNFILIEILDKDNKPSNEVAFALYNELAVNNEVVVRFRGKEQNCTGALRISIGTEEENKILVQKFAKCLEQVRNKV
ncbi:histidinol-phosphate aminotransferase [Scheffersomyces xylosifermentans]|uniref:histidinol-phosphate aminotransferase n=1 Tax=Scheffersomyces xylosifermentans TaxID=1304137 RepID=UPI00315D1EA4